MYADLTEAAGAIRQGGATASELIEAAIARADGSDCQAVYVRRFDAGARAAAAAVDTLLAAEQPVGPLAGLAVSIKDLFDVAGAPTTAGSRVLETRPPALADAPAVARLRQAGAALTGHTNMTEFAFSGVGINPHHGTPANPATRTLDAADRITGGSTSGGAASVAAGAAWAALGSDTGGSIRIPAALTGLVGFKNTARLTPTEGSIPLSPTLDTVSAITRSVRDAILLHELLAARRVARSGRGLAHWRLAVPTTTFFDGAEPEVVRSFERAIAALAAAGARIEEIGLSEVKGFEAVGALGGFAAAEAWADHRGRLDGAEASRYDARVAQRMRRGASIGAADYIDMHRLRAAAQRAVMQAVLGCDALLSPTVPIVAPPLQPLIDDDERFFAANGLLLRNPSVINQLDGCALSLPCHAPGAWPVGLMVWGPALADDTVLEVGLAIEAALRAAHG